MGPCVHDSRAYSYFEAYVFTLLGLTLDAGTPSLQSASEYTHTYIYTHPHTRTIPHADSVIAAHTFRVPELHLTLTHTHTTPHADTSSIPAPLA